MKQAFILVTILFGLSCKKDPASNGQASLSGSKYVSTNYADTLYSNGSPIIISNSQPNDTLVFLTSTTGIFENWAGHVNFTYDIKTGYYQDVSNPDLVNKFLIIDADNIKIYSVEHPGQSIHNNAGLFLTKIR